MKISALILTNNEEIMISDCLKQLDFVDEIILLDQNSADKTQEIAKRYTKRIYTTKSEAFDYVPRLIRRSQLINWEGKVHETPKIQGQFGHFKSPLIHLTGRNLSQMLKKSIKWAKIEAELYYKTYCTKVSALKVSKALFFEFFKRYFIKMGFLDGQAGLLESIYQTFHQAIVLVYLWELQNNAQKKIK